MSSCLRFFSPHLSSHVSLPPTQQCTHPHSHTHSPTLTLSQVLALKQAVKQTQTETRQADAEVARQELDNQTLAQQLEHMQGEYNRIEDIKFDVAAKLDEKFLQKQMVRGVRCFSFVLFCSV